MRCAREHAMGGANFLQRKLGTEVRRQFSLIKQPKGASRID